MTTPQRTVGQVGLGLLGSAIAERLLAAGFSVQGFDLDSQKQNQFAAIGGTTPTYLDGLFQSCKTVLLCLPSSDVVVDLLADFEPVLDQHILIDATTGRPEQMISLAQQLKERHGVDYVEATVAGSSGQMRSGSATLFLGGDPDVIQSVRPMLDALTSHHFHLGAVGSASRFKLVHNLILGLNRAVLAEGLSFAESLGFSPARALDILKKTPAASAVMETKGEKMAHRDWKPEARLSQHLKDVQLILELAEECGAPVPLSEVHRELLERSEQLGFGDADNSAVLEGFQNRLNPP
jgi:3-hydroxyisobutyrate dehydrogenase-like beta-hydroxyacid dehydrogenase